MTKMSHQKNRLQGQVILRYTTTITYDDFPLPVGPSNAFNPGFITPLKIKPFVKIHKEVKNTPLA